VTKIGSQILVEGLAEEGVDTIFGIPGGVLIPLFDVLYDSDLRVILTRHEQGAGHAADGYARATGKAGVCIATSGPGATNLTTALATANFDSVAVVAITGQVATHMIGNDAFQEADITGITRSITKHNYLVTDVADLGRVIKEAFHVARTGRPGPVLIDLPVDVTTAEHPGRVDKRMDLPGYKPKLKGHPRQIKLAADAINASERPVLYVGGGVIISGAHEELRTLARKANLPVTTTLLGLGAFPENDDLSLRMLGMHGTVYANLAIHEADLVIAVGARFDDRITGKIDEFAPHAKIVHVDIDPTSISKSILVDIPVVGDAKDVLAGMVKLVEHKDRKPWMEKIAAWKRENPLSYKKDKGRVQPKYVIEQICELTRGEAIICTEVGQHQMWAAQFFTYTKPRRFISSGGLGTMGYGFPAAIGAQVGCPGAIVFDIAGDGSFQMNIQELSTAVYNKLPVNVAIMDNGYLGMVRQWQEFFFDKRYSSTDLDPGNPDFVKIAEAYGALGIRVTSDDDVRDALAQAIASDQTVVLDFVCEREENVFPMIPAGRGIRDMMRGMA